MKLSPLEQVLLRPYLSNVLKAGAEAHPPPAEVAPPGQVLVCFLCVRAGGCTATWRAVLREAIGAELGAVGTEVAAGLPGFGQGAFLPMAAHLTVHHGAEELSIAGLCVPDPADDRSDAQRRQLLTLAMTRLFQVLHRIYPTKRPR